MTDHCHNPLNSAADTDAARNPSEAAKDVLPHFGQLSDVPIDLVGRPREIRDSHVALFVLIAAALAIGGVKVWYQVPMAGWIGIGILFATGAIAYMVSSARRSRREILNEIARLRKPNVAEWIRDIMDNLRTVSSARLIESLIQFMIQSGDIGRAIRIADEKHLQLLQPISVEFEPRILDEADDCFHELSQALHEPLTPRLTNTRFDPVEHRAWRIFTARVRQAGGWSGALVAAIFLIRYSIESYRVGSVTTELWVCTVLTFVCLLQFAGFTLRPRCEWYLVPSGLIVRTLAGRSRSWLLDHFDRRECVLIASRGIRNLWSVSVAMPSKLASRTCTEAEVAMLLRAWLSPLPPPTLDKLSDLQ